jgi:hypothetical protein
LKTQSGEIMPLELGVPEMLEAAMAATEIEPEKVIKAYGAVWACARALNELKPETTSRCGRSAQQDVHGGFQATTAVGRLA